MAIPVVVSTSVASDGDGISAMLAKAGQPYRSRLNLGLKRVLFFLSSTFVAPTDSSLSSIESRDDDTA